MDNPTDTMRRIAGRLTHFMAEPTLEQARQIRESYAVELRIKKRADFLIKRRTVTSPSKQVKLAELSAEIAQIEPLLGDLSLPPSQRLVLLKNLLIQDLPLRYLLIAMKLLRDLLTSEATYDTTDLAVEIGLGPACMRLCDTKVYSEEVIYEAAWCLCNMASGRPQSTDALVRDGVNPVFFSLLDYDSPIVLEHAIWGIGNVIGDKIAYRDELLSFGVAYKLQRVTENYSEQMASVYPVIAWTCSNIVRSLPLPSFSQCLIIGNILLKLATFESTPALDHDLLWAIANFTDSENTLIQHVVETRLLGFVMEHLKSEDVGLLKSAVRCAGNIVSGNNLQTQMILEAGLLDLMDPLLSHANAGIRKESYWALSNVAAGTRHHAEMILGHRLVNRTPFGLIDASDEVAREAAWLFFNVCKNSSAVLCLQLVNRCNLFSQMAQAFEKSDSVLLEKLISISQYLLQVGESCVGQNSNEVAHVFEQTGCFAAVKKLVFSSSLELSAAASALLKKFFEEQQQVEELDLERPAVFNFS